MRKSVQAASVMFIAIAADLTMQKYEHFGSAGLFLLPAIAVVGMIAGLGGAFVAAAISVAFVAVMSIQHGSLVQMPSDRLLRLGVLCVSAPVIALVVGVLQRRSQQMAELQLTSERSQAALRAHRFELERATLLTRDQLSQQRANDLIGSVPGVVWETSIETEPGAVTGRDRGEDLFAAVFVSSYAQRLLGYPLEQWTRNPAFWLDIIHPQDRTEVANRIQTICNCGGGSPGIDSVPLEFRWMDQNGSPVWVETRLVRLMSDNRCVGFRAVTLDINQRKQLEQNLRQRATELAALTDSLRHSNQELDQFAYVTSHDLKAPLRGISNLSHWIEEDLGDRFTPEAREQMRLLRGRVVRMESLINALLEYSHVGRTQGKTRRINTAELLAGVIEWIGGPKELHIEIDPQMPVFETDAIRLQQVFSNLLENAVKHHGRPQGHIRVACRDLGDFFEFSVIDDGKGIEERYHERIFTIFQTLQPRDQVEGAGIGLSLVKKIVQSKGGRVSLESEPGHGAVFRFTWPKSEGGKEKQ
jgi:PAS domain S-box-containing protein